MKKLTKKVGFTVRDEHHKEGKAQLCKREAETSRKFQSLNVGLAGNTNLEKIIEDYKQNRKNFNEQLERSDMSQAEYYLNEINTNLTDLEKLKKEVIWQRCKPSFLTDLTDLEKSKKEVKSQRYKPSFST